MKLCHWSIRRILSLSHLFKPEKCSATCFTPDLDGRRATFLRSFRSSNPSASAIVALSGSILRQPFPKRAMASFAPKAHYYAGGTLNRASWLRETITTTNALLASQQARIILFNASNPLCRVQNHQASLVELPWSAVKAYMPEKTFRAPEDLVEVKLEQEDRRPLCIFLGVQDGQGDVLPHSKDIVPVRPFSPHHDRLQPESESVAHRMNLLTSLSTRQPCLN